MRSVDVVFPASICAIIPMLRVSSSLNALPMCPGSACFADTCFPDCGFAVPCFVVSCCVESFTGTIQPSFHYVTLLPAIVRESLVGFGHAMHIFFFLHGAAASVRSVDQLVSQLIDHGLARAFPRILQQPANGQRLPAERIYFHGNLVVRTTDTPGLYFQQRLYVLDRLVKNLQRIVVRFLGYLVHRAIKCALRRG